MSHLVPRIAIIYLRKAIDFQNTCKMKVNKPVYTHYEMGSLDGLESARFSMGNEMEVSGKRFFGELLGLTGMEVSLHRVERGGSMPFLHAHRRNEELYLFLGGQGEFQVDGSTFPVGEGSLVRVAPEGRRAWRNSGSAALVYLCVQAPADSGATRTISDGVMVKEPLVWPDAAES